MTDSEERRLNWAHSVLNDRGSTDKELRAAKYVIAKLDPEYYLEKAIAEDYLGDSIY